MILTIAAILLLAVIAWQNIQYPQLRNLTISDGLYQEVPNFWALDAAYVLLAGSLVYVAPNIFTALAAGSFLITAISNTFSTWVDKITGGKHNSIHTDATIGTFLFTLLWQVGTVKNWGVTIAEVALPVAVYLWSKSGPYAEKTAVLILCLWLALFGIGA